jgi:hypothetical protein
VRQAFLIVAMSTRLRLFSPVRFPGPSVSFATIDNRLPLYATTSIGRGPEAGIPGRWGAVSRAPPECGSARPMAYEPDKQLSEGERIRDVVALLPKVGASRFWKCGCRPARQSACGFLRPRCARDRRLIRSRLPRSVVVGGAAGSRPWWAGRSPLIDRVPGVVSTRRGAWASGHRVSTRAWVAESATSMTAVAGRRGAAGTRVAERGVGRGPRWSTRRTSGTSAPRPGRPAPSATMAGRGRPRKGGSTARVRPDLRLSLLRALVGQLGACGCRQSMPYRWLALGDAPGLLLGRPIGAVSRPPCWGRRMSSSLVTGGSMRGSGAAELGDVLPAAPRLPPENPRRSLTISDKKRSSLDGVCAAQCSFLAVVDKVLAITVGNKRL